MKTIEELRADLKAAQETLDAAKSARDEVKRRLVLMSPFKVGQVLIQNRLERRIVVTGVTVDDEGRFGLVTYPVKKGGLRSQIGRRYIYLDYEGASLQDTGERMGI